MGNDPPAGKGTSRQHPFYAKLVNHKKERKEKMTVDERTRDGTVERESTFGSCTPLIRRLEQGNHEERISERSDGTDAQTIGALREHLHSEAFTVAGIPCIAGHA